MLLFLFVCYALGDQNKWGIDTHPGWWDRDTCMVVILDLLDEGNLSYNNTSVFRQDSPDGPIYNGIKNMTVTPGGCLQYCGNHTMYWDWPPRSMTWIVPVVLLLTNIELSPIDKKRFMTIAHAIGDPIDSFWSIVHKIYIWRRLYRIGAGYSEGWTDPTISKIERGRVIATVLSGFKEIAGAKIENELYYVIVCKLCGIRANPAEEDRAKFDEWRRTARILADARTYEFIRTCFAMVVYIVAVVVALEPVIGGGNTSPPGGRIGSAIYLSWLIPLALLSSRVGNFTSTRSCLTILRDFVHRVSDEGAGAVAPEGDAPQDENAAAAAQMRAPEIQPAPQPPYVLPPFTFKHHGKGDDIELKSDWFTVSQQPVEQEPASLKPLLGGHLADDIERLIKDEDWKHYFDSLHWLGAIYTYRPWKVIYLDVDHRTHAHRSNVTMVLTGIFPVTVSTVCAFLIMCYAVPVGFSCRHIWVVGLYLVWLASAAATSCMYLLYKDRWREHTMWIVALAKDIIVGCGVLVLVFGSTSGLFNSCWCWGLANQVAVGIGYVPLASDDEYNKDAQHQYRAIVYTCLAFQVCFFVGLILRWRDSLHLVRWPEKQRRREWTHELGDTVAYTPENKFLFWHRKSQLLVEVDLRRNRAETFQSQNPRSRRRSVWNRSSR
jgi:hypothetical protein